MKEMSLKEVQSVNLEIMKDIHSFCEKNGIHYSLAYGTLIGAIRHKGFIPWDNDIDVMMPRPDFERFSREYKSANGYRLSSAYDDDTYVNFTRVYNSETLVEAPLVPAKFDIGVWVDIFPIDAIPDDETIRKDQFKRLRRFTHFVMIYRAGWVRWKKTKSVTVRIKALFRQLQLLLVARGNFKFWHNRIIEICNENKFGTTKRCSSLLCVEANAKNKQEIFSIDDFKDFELHPFENEFFYIASGYDNILRSIFGDYMRLPPEEKRHSHSLSSFYWKD